MTDEKFVFTSDVADKKRTAMGAHNKKTHAGKGGKVKFPSDYMTKKELDAMSGEVKSYKMNSPMTWAEFKALPDDLKSAYINLLRKRFNVSDAKIAHMMGISSPSFSQYMSKRGFTSAPRGKDTKWDSEGWYSWVNGIPAADAANETADEVAEIVPDELPEAEYEASVTPVEKPCIPIPVKGEITFESNADSALTAIKEILNNSFVRLTVSWEQLSGDING